MDKLPTKSQWDDKTAQMQLAELKSLLREHLRERHTYTSDELSLLVDVIGAVDRAHHQLHMFRLKRFGREVFGK